ncbi:MAG: fumarylacetoacetate hydrolase family protein [Halanaerobiaceae bacterium]
MKIVRYRDAEGVSYGQRNGDKIYRIQGDIFATYRVTGEEVNAKQVKFLAPVLPPNIFAIGLNYRQHARETGHELPDKPVIFIKATTSVTGPSMEIKLPEMAPEKVDYEAELAVIIGRKARNIEEDEVDNYILGYTCANDVSARDCQHELDVQWARAKSFDTFCPLGPSIETELEPDDLFIRSYLNGKVMQESRTSDMIFSVPKLVSYLSRNFTLLPGTVILTGTPEGVGFAREPQVFMRPGDEIEIEIEGIDTLCNQIKGE